ncbi:MAG: hypothetical protein HHJ11_05510 [Phycicoccus sp.]|nr:hypothetical protein [Phycicoccus sp.]
MRAWRAMAWGADGDVVRAARPGVSPSFADWMGVSHARGGLNLGSGPVTLALAALIIGFVTYLTRTGSKDNATAARQASSGPNPVVDRQVETQPS